MAKFFKLNVDGFLYAYDAHANGLIADAVLGDNLLLQFAMSSQ